MFIDTEKNQKFLSLIWSLQKNDSNAAIVPKLKGRAILDKTVYRAYDYANDEPIYSLEPMQDIRSEASEPKPMKKGGRPPALTAEQKENVTKWHNMSISNREIARKLGVSEKTVRKCLKGE